MVNINDIGAKSPPLATPHDMEGVICPVDEYKIMRTPKGVLRNANPPQGILPDHKHGNTDCDYAGLPVPVVPKPSPKEHIDGTLVFGPGFAYFNAPVIHVPVHPSLLEKHGQSKPTVTLDKETNELTVRLYVEINNKQSITIGIGLTNFPPTQLHLYEQAIRKYGDPDLVIRKSPIRPIKGDVVCLNYLSLHYLGNAKKDLGAFWKILDPLIKEFYKFK